MLDMPSAWADFDQRRERNMNPAAAGACHDHPGRSRIGLRRTLGRQPDHAKAVGFTWGPDSTDCPSVRVILRVLRLLSLLEGCDTVALRAIWVAPASPQCPRGAT
jgi:hypothetical protein